MPNTFNADLILPSSKAQKALKTLVKFLTDRGLTDTGGCKAFYTPAEWKARGEDYGHRALFIVVHDGGDLAMAFNLDYEEYKLNDDLLAAMENVGCRVDACTGWYSAVYPI